MINELIKLMQNQEEDLKKLLELLETQYKMIMSKDVFGLEGLVDKVNECAKIIAKQEKGRRDLTGNINITEIVNSSNNEELKKAHSSIKKILDEVKQCKDTNELLLKQQLLFTNKMINIMNPNREIKIYNSYGNLSK